jgi:predicted nucleotide-binding protein
MSQPRNPKRQQPRVFISHSNVDAVFARHVRNLLVQRLNAQVFTTEDLSAGEKWQSKLRNELSSTDVVVALLTPNPRMTVGYCTRLGQPGRSRSQSYRW